MPLDRPRRIFRSGSLAPARGRRDLRPTLLAGALGALLVGVVILLSMPGVLFGRVPVPSGLLTAEPRQVAVVDGGTLRLADAVVRLRGVDAPARGRMCHGADGHEFDCGAAAADALAGMVRDHAVACRLAGRDAAGLVEARCEAGGVQLNRALVAAGWARADGADDLQAAERDARNARRGLWAANGL